MNREDARTLHPAAQEEKRKLAVRLSKRGMKNKEIATEVGTTEQVVKNYLRKVYDKLGVADRLELALYCIHHRLLHKQEQADQAKAADAKAMAQGKSAPDGSAAQKATGEKQV